MASETAVPAESAGKDATKADKKGDDKKKGEKKKGEKKKGGKGGKKLSTKLFREKKRKERLARLEKEKRKESKTQRARAAKSAVRLTGRVIRLFECGYGFIRTKQFKASFFFCLTKCRTHDLKKNDLVTFVVQPDVRFPKDGNPRFKYYAADVARRTYSDLKEARRVAEQHRQRSEAGQKRRIAAQEAAKKSDEKGEKTEATEATKKTKKTKKKEKGKTLAKLGAKGKVAQKSGEKGKATQDGKAAKTGGKEKSAAKGKETRKGDTKAKKGGAAKKGDEQTKEKSKDTGSSTTAETAPPPA